MSQQPFRLAKAVSWFMIMASAVSQEYGAGINAVATSSLGSYPGVGNLVPLAMFVAGLLLLPKVFMWQRFGGVAPSSGGTYVWMSRTIHPRVGFLIHFLYWVGVLGAMGFVAYAAGSTLASTLVGLGYGAGAWFATFEGHVVIGLVFIWSIFVLHVTGVRNYGWFVTVLFGIILVAATTSIAVGFGTSHSAFEAALSSKIFGGPVPNRPIPPLTYTAFFGTVTLFLFAYGGLSGAINLGGEARNAKRDMPIGTVGAWLAALILFTLVASAVFHAMSASDAIALISSKHSYYATVPGILSLVAPPLVGDVLSILVTIIIVKTIAPEMMDTSRTLFAWSQDSLVPKIFGHTNRFKAPDFALFVAALLGSVFLVNSALVGVNSVVLRSVSIVLVFMFVGIGVLLTALKKDKKEWEKKVATPAMVVAAVAAIAVGLVLIPSVIVVPHTPLWLQPSFQLVVSLLVAIATYEAARVHAKARTGKDISEEIMSRLPLE